MRTPNSPYKQGRPVYASLVHELIKRNLLCSKMLLLIITATMLLSMAGRTCSVPRQPVGAGHQLHYYKTPGPPHVLSYFSGPLVPHQRITLLVSMTMSLYLHSQAVLSVCNDSVVNPVPVPRRVGVARLAVALTPPPGHGAAQGLNKVCIPGPRLTHFLSSMGAPEILHPRSVSQKSSAVLGRASSDNMLKSAASSVFAGPRTPPLLPPPAAAHPKPGALITRQTLIPGPYSTCITCEFKCNININTHLYDPLNAKSKLYQNTGIIFIVVIMFLELNTIYCERPKCFGCIFSHISSLISSSICNKIIYFLQVWVNQNVFMLNFSTIFLLKDISGLLF